jgi:hypothetical protein
MANHARNKLKSWQILPEIKEFGSHASLKQCNTHPDPAGLFTCANSGTFSQ